MQEIADALRDTDIPVLVKNPVNPDLDLWIGALERLNRAGIRIEHPFYKELQDERCFAEMRVQNGELVWKTGQDFCPNTLYEKSILL